MSQINVLGPVGFNSTGNYDNTKQYEKLDVVYYEGSSYVAIQSSIGQLPTNTTYWDKIAGKGDTGNGIASITKTSTSGLVDTYTITFTNGQTTTYEVTNGADGDVVDVQVDGTSVVDNGVANIILADIEQELEDMYNLLPKVSGTGETITLNNTAVGKMLFNLKGDINQEGTPIPTSPQTIHVVKGNNTITISNGDNTQSQIYSINLGTLELCKIGTYQDYFYKDNGKWYVHKETGSVTLDGTEGWSTVGSGGTAGWYTSALSNFIKDIPKDLASMYCTHYGYGGAGGNPSAVGALPTQFILNVSSGTSVLNGNMTISKTNYSTKTTLTNELSEKKPTIYYQLYTPTNTEITDNTLVGQLELLAKARSYLSTTNVTQSNDDLSFIMDVIALEQTTQ